MKVKDKVLRCHRRREWDRRGGRPGLIAAARRAARRGGWPISRAPATKLAAVAGDIDGLAVTGDGRRGAG